MHCVALLLPPGFDPMCLAPLSAFTLANTMLGQPAYAISAVSETGSPIQSAYGVDVLTQCFALAPIDTLFLAPAPADAGTTPETATFLRTAMADSIRIAAIDLAVLTLADAGLLAGRRVAIRASHAMELTRRSPNTQIEVNEAVAQDGRLLSSSSLVASIDLAISLIARDFGPELARAVSRNLIKPPLPSSQLSWDGALHAAGPRSERIQRALAFARNNLQTDLAVERLAEIACLSPRQLTRVFRSELGRSPAQAIEQIRIEAARRLLAQRRLPVELVAEETGFGGRERMRRAFIRCFGKSPQAMRDEAIA